MKPDTPTKPCPQCGNDFARKERQAASDWRRQKFCSRRCSASFYAAERMPKINAGRARAMADPERLRCHKKKLREQLAKVRPLSAVALREKAVGWCPPEYRDAYRHMLYGKRLGLKASRAAIRQQIESDARRQINRITEEMHAKQEREKAMAY